MNVKIMLNTRQLAARIPLAESTLRDALVRHSVIPDAAAIFGSKVQELYAMDRLPALRSALLPQEPEVAYVN